MINIPFEIPAKYRRPLLYVGYVGFALFVAVWISLRAVPRLPFYPAQLPDDFLPDHPMLDGWARWDAAVIWLACALGAQGVQLSLCRYYESSDNRLSRSGEWVGMLAASELLFASSWSLPLFLFWSPGNDSRSLTSNQGSVMEANPLVH